MPFSPFPFFPPSAQPLKPRSAKAHQAARVHALRAAAVGGILALLTLWGLQANKIFAEKQADAEATRLVDGLMNADTAKFNEALVELNSYRRWANPKLESEFQQAAERSDSQLHAALALMPEDETKRNLIKRRLLEPPAAKFITVRNLYQPFSSPFLDEFWTIALDSSANRDTRFPAAAALAGWTPEDPRWQNKQLGEFIAEYLVSVLPSDLVPWRDALRPVSPHILSPLAAIYRDTEQGEQQLNFATDSLRDYASEDLDILCDLLLDGKPQQFVSLFDSVANFGDAAIAKLQQASHETPMVRRNDAPLNTAWHDPDLQCCALGRCSSEIPHRSRGTEISLHRHQAERLRRKDDLLWRPERSPPWTGMRRPAWGPMRLAGCTRASVRWEPTPRQRR